MSLLLPEAQDGMNNVIMLLQFQADAFLQLAGNAVGVAFSRGNILDECVPFVFGNGLL